MQPTARSSNYLPCVTSYQQLASESKETRIKLKSLMEDALELSKAQKMEYEKEKSELTAIKKVITQRKCEAISCAIVSQPFISRTASDLCVTQHKIFSFQQLAILPYYSLSKEEKLAMKEKCSVDLKSTKEETKETQVQCMNIIKNLSAAKK